MTTSLTIDVSQLVGELGLDLNGTDPVAALSRLPREEMLRILDGYEAGEMLIEMEEDLRRDNNFLALFYNKEEIDYIFGELRHLVSTIWILIASVQIVTMQMGFAFFEVGTVQNKNKTNILLKNLLGTFIGMIGYYFMGFAIANYANGGLVGNGPFFCLGINTDGLLKFVFQFSYAVTATTIVTGSLAERFHIDTYIAFAFIMCSVIYPVPASWVWGGGWLSEYGFADYAGSGIVCMTGGFAGFSGSVLLGPRIGRFDEDLDYKNTKKKMQMLSKERQNKKTKQNKKQKDKVGKKKVTPNEKAEDKRKTEKAQGHKKKNKGKKVVDKVKKNGYESFGSDENVDD